MSDGSSGATALLGMDGFVVLAMIEEDGELFISVETTASVVGCGSCGVRATGHGRAVIQIRALPCGGRPVRLVWKKRKWICRDPDCAAKSFTERSDLVEDSLTRGAAAEICRKVGEYGSSVAQVAREFGVGWECAMNCVRRHGEPLVDGPSRLDNITALGIAEHKMLSANGEHYTEYVTCFVDVKGGRLLDIVRGPREWPIGLRSLARTGGTTPPYECSRDRISGNTHERNMRFHQSPSLLQATDAGTVVVVEGAGGRGKPVSLARARLANAANWGRFGVPLVP